MTQKPQGQPILNDKTLGFAANGITKPEHLLGISDLTHAVDSRSKAVLAAEEFAAALCRLEIMKGEHEQQGRNILAQKDRVRECHAISMKTQKDEMSRAIGSQLGDITLTEWEKMSSEEKKVLLGKQEVGR